MTTTKKRSPTSFRLSLEAISLVGRMADKLGVSKTAVVEMALRDKAERVLKRKRKARTA